MIECPECGGRMYPTRHHVQLECQVCDYFEQIAEPEADK